MPHIIRNFNSSGAWIGVGVGLKPFNFNTSYFQEKMNGLIDIIATSNMKNDVLMTGTGNRVFNDQNIESMKNIEEPISHPDGTKIGRKDLSNNSPIDLTVTGNNPSQSNTNINMNTNTKKIFLFIC